jgi:GNAT superfamily N-acetyltransferase
VSFPPRAEPNRRAWYGATARRIVEGMRRELGDGYELDDDPARVDPEAVIAFLQTTYWASDRPAGAIRATIAGSRRVVGLYHRGEQVGYCRAVSDGVTMAYLADVYVLPAHRERGLGTALVEEMISGGDLAGVHWMLHTLDAHGLYAKLGFGPAGERFMERST